MRHLAFDTLNRLNRGPCTSSTSCLIVDWSLLSTDLGNNDLGIPLLLNTVNSPTIDNLSTHIWAGADSTTFLEGVIELAGDYRGNDNGLCELYLDEVCAIAPNIGAYQGHGSILDADDILLNDPATIEFKQFEFNGY